MYTKSKPYEFTTYKQLSLEFVPHLEVLRRAEGAELAFYHDPNPSAPN
jgi:hypothetical protein